MKSKKYYLYVFNHGRTIDKGLVTITDDGWVLEDDQPIEDYGDWYVSETPTDTPFEDWLAMQERSIEIKEEIQIGNIILEKGDRIKVLKESTKVTGELDQLARSARQLAIKILDIYGEDQRSMVNELMAIYNKVLDVQKDAMSLR